ncbi:MAG: single-stranded DNA-binding protein [Parcubacteria group bacterium]
MDLNRAQIIGRLTRDPELRTTPQGTSVASFGMATNYVWTDASGQKQEKVEYHNIVVWRKLAEICGQYLKKGSKVFIEGRLQTREWEGQDGVKRFRTEIVCDNLIMLDRPTGQSAPAGNSGASTGFSSKPAAPANEMPIINVENTEIPQANDGEEEIKVENIPF